MRSVLPATIRFSIEFFSRSSFMDVRGARTDLSCATDKISLGNGPSFTVEHPLDSATKILPEYIANSYLTNPYKDVFCITQSYISHIWSSDTFHNNQYTFCTLLL
jgi:hypothetical protein